MRQRDVHTPDAEVLLEFIDLQVGHHDADPLFDPLSLAISEGEIVALRGRSGAGKSTALAAAMGLKPPLAGSVLWRGSSLYDLDEPARAALRRRHFGIVLQDGGLLSGLTALENVLVPVLHHRAGKTDRARAHDALGMVGLAGRATHTPDRLSGGEARRVAIARALFADPQLLIIDEHTSSLDRRAADTVIGLIREVAAGSRGVLIASHDPAVIALAHRVHDIEG